MTTLTLESRTLRVDFDAATCTIAALHNKLTGETYGVSGDQFAIQLDDRGWAQCDFRLTGYAADNRTIRAQYVSYPAPGQAPTQATAQGSDQAPVLPVAAGDATAQPPFRVEVVYTLGDAGHYVEKRVTLTSALGGALRRVVVSSPHFHAADVRVVCYKHPTYERVEAQHHGALRREPGTEPLKTYFGRTARGGFFTGLEMAFDSSSITGDQVHLSFAPSLKFRAAHTLACDAAYFGVYARGARDARADQWRPYDVPAPAVLPLPSESLAVTAMVRSSFGSPRFGLVAMVCGWHSQMEQFAYTPQTVAGDMKSLDFLAECGLDGVTDSHPWAGETAKMNAMTGDAPYDLGELPRQVLAHAKKVGVKVIQWPTMNHTHPWAGFVTAGSDTVQGGPFRADRPDWVRGSTVPTAPSLWTGDFHASVGNCFANRPFFEWIRGVIFQALDTGLYDAWCMDGDFWGWGAYYHGTVPVECTSDKHDHLVADANFACQRALDELIASVRERYPHFFIAMCRPPMDLGVWSNRHADVCFTIIETGSGTSNLAGGNEIRLASRIRVHHHFFPHAMDWAVLFPSFQQPRNLPPWPSAKLDYILLSAMSCSPSMLMYLPTKMGMPEADKQELRRWLEWGRKNQAYLMVRHDLPEWPAPGRVDGSAHMVDGRGLIFLFNPSDRAMPAEFTLSQEGIGLDAAGSFNVRQEHPASNEMKKAAQGQTIKWEVPAQTAVVLRVEPG